MRALHVLTALVACSSSEQRTAESVRLAVPVASTAAVLAAAAKPPLVVILDERGLAVATVATWEDLTTKPVRSTVANVDEISRMIREQPAPPPLGLVARAPGTRGPLGGQAARPRGDGLPSRVASVGGEVMPELAPLYAVLVTAPATKASRVIDAVTRLDVAIAVAHAGKVRPLRVQFVASPEPTAQIVDGWIEARVHPTGITLEAVPDVPIELATLDAIPLAAAIEKARKTRGLAGNVPVDVLVTPEIDAQRLVDVLVALDGAGVRMIGMGMVPTGDEAKRRGQRIAKLVLGEPSVQGDLAKDAIAAVLERHEADFLACYLPALAEAPNLAGTIQAQFFVTPSGDVAAVATTGLDTKVGDCIKAVIAKLQFPKPIGGGGAQVQYPLTFRT